jgi:hypothetical protein
MSVIQQNLRSLSSTLPMLDSIGVIPPLLVRLLKWSEHVATISAVDRARESLAMWRQLTNRQVPTVDDARAEFARTLVLETDMLERQATEMALRLSPASHRLSNIVDWLSSASEHFLSLVRPWFPVWNGYVSWALNWCVSHGYREVGFLCKDSLPLYVLARRALRTAGSPTTLRLLHASRSVVRSPHFAAHFARTFSPTRAIAFIDTGCYGSILTKILDAAKDRCEDCCPAVFFFFSRNPNIFGYMNYLMAWRLLGNADNITARLLCDFAVYAGDVLEALPKGYRLAGLRNDGMPDVRPHDLISFAMAVSLLAELYTAAAGASDQPRQRDEAYEASTRLWRIFSLPDSEPEKRESFLFTSCVPKAVPEVPLYVRLNCFLPQEEMFGTAAG